MLNREQFDFIHTGVSIGLSSVSPDGTPRICRGVGSKVLEDGKRIGVFVIREQAAAVLDNIRVTGKVAGVFCLPSDNRTVQLKGTDAREIPFDPRDFPIIEEHTNHFVRQVVPLGFMEPMVRTLFSCTPENLVTIIYTPSEAFSQTPGPKAGQPIEADL